MPNIVSTSDFQKGELKIANAVSQNPGDGINGDLQEIIDKYEKELLLDTLGSAQYAQLQTELGGTPSTHWQNLIDDYLKPMLLPYVYCKWLRFDEVKMTTVGAGKGKAQAFSVSDVNHKYSARWNEFSDAVEELGEHLEDDANFTRPDDFPCYSYENSFGL